MTPFAVDLSLPFDTQHLRDLAVHECDNTVRHQFRVDRAEMDESVMRFLGEQGISISHAEAFFTPPNSLLPIHVDGPELNDISKLNWCWGAPESWMMWWKLKKGITPEVRTTGIGTRYLTMQAKDCVPIHRARIKAPTLVNVGRPHSVMNNTASGRWVLSLVLWDLLEDRHLMMHEALTRLSRWVQDPQLTSSADQR